MMKAGKENVPGEDPSGISETGVGEAVPQSAPSPAEGEIAVDPSAPPGDN